MSILKVVEWPDKILETRSEEVTLFNDDFKNFCADMHETMHAANGIGLAANQVGVAKRVLTIHIPYDEEDAKSPKEPWHDTSFTFVNPVIDKKQGKIRWQEGCLSFPEIFEFVDRAAEVWVSAVNENGEPFQVHATGLFAVCLQHEIDHIDGVVFINRMSQLKASMVKKKILRRGRLELEATEV